MFTFELGGITRHLMADLTGNSEFLKPLMFPWASSQNIEDLRKTKLTVSLGTSH